MFNNKARIGTAYGKPDSAGRIALFGIAGLSDDAETLTVRYEATQHPECAILQYDGNPDAHGHAYIDLPRSAFASVKYTRYLGDEVATADRVVHYLLSNYSDKLRQPLSPRYLREVVTGSPELATAEELVSFAFYPGNKIADALGFLMLGDEDVDNPEEDEDAL